jgi:hypothetical protein
VVAVEAGKLNLFGWLRRRRRKSSSERLPWYRAPDYSGNLTEAEKRQLDAFRMQARHPAARYGPAARPSAATDCSKQRMT